jgi:Acetyltransferase (GNAT) domain
METAAMARVMKQESTLSQVVNVAKVIEAPATDLQIELIQDYDTFLGLEPVWNRLVAESGIDFPFIRHEWVRMVWDCFKSEGSLYIVLVKDKSKTVALAPLMIERGRMYGYPVRRLRGISNVFSERYDFIVASRPEEACCAVWKFLASRSKEWDVLELRQLPPGAHALQAIPRLAIGDRFLVGRWESSQGPYIPIARTWADYENGRSRKFMSNLKGRMKGLRRLGPVTHEVVQGGEGLSKAVDDAFRLEGVAWKRKAGTAIVCHPKREAFYRGLIQSAAQQGLLRLYFLVVNNERVAVQITLLHHNKLYVLKAGYDPRFAASAPSHVLIWLLLEEAWKLTYDEVDLLGAIESWKTSWADDVRLHSWLFVFPDRPSCRILHRIKFHLLPRIRSNVAFRLLIKGGMRFGLKAHDE